ncbi:hypothetical protein GGX14DRAFT_389192 [Mycena pura]|uniref:Uncharacterized protein n=1 Tax=Mycena pura TaxID=153505 RepID=A0AAD6YKK9_9AGAR|nr:hypothetical protein GGX14DRAFT_389192 [Mycena pura]
MSHYVFYVCTCTRTAIFQRAFLMPHAHARAAFDASARARVFGYLSCKKKIIVQTARCTRVVLKRSPALRKAVARRNECVCGDVGWCGAEREQRWASKTCPCTGQWGQRQRRASRPSVQAAAPGVEPSVQRTRRLSARARLHERAWGRAAPAPGVETQRAAHGTEDSACVHVHLSARAWGQWGATPAPGVETQRARTHGAVENGAGAGRRDPVWSAGGGARARTHACMSVQQHRAAQSGRGAARRKQAPCTLPRSWERAHGVARQLQRRASSACVPARGGAERQLQCAGAGHRDPASGGSGSGCLTMRGAVRVTRQRHQPECRASKASCAKSAECQSGAALANSCTCLDLRPDFPPSLVIYVAQAGVRRVEYARVSGA